MSVRSGRGLEIVEIRKRNAGQPLTELPLDALQRPFLGLGDKHIGVAFRLGPGGAADAMNVVIRHVGHVETDDVSDVVDVNSARRNVGGHEHLEISSPKSLHGFVPLRLREVAMQLGDRSRPGVAMTTSTPARNAFSWGPIGAPPTRIPTRSGV
jgi:hypothetical protein